MGKKVTPAGMKALRDFAWEWDVIGLGHDAREFADNEYDCVLEPVIGMLGRGASVDEIVTFIEEFVPIDMGIRCDRDSTVQFAERMHYWWAKQTVE